MPGTGAGAGGHSPVQQGQQGEPLVAHRGPAARKKPALVAVLGAGWRLLHQRLLLGFVQGVLVQQVKLQSPQPRPSAPRPPQGSLPPLPVSTRRLGDHLFQHKSPHLLVALRPALTPHREGLLPASGPRTWLSGYQRHLGLPGATLTNCHVCLPHSGNLSCLFPGSVKSTLSFGTSTNATYLSGRAIRVALTSPPRHTGPEDRPGANASAVRPWVNYLTSLGLLCPSCNKNLQGRQWTWPCAGLWDTRESQRCRAPISGGGHRLCKDDTATSYEG